MSWAIPLTTVKVSEDDVQAVLDCLRSGWLTMGPRTQDFEAAFAEYCDVPDSVAVSSGTAALHLALAALGVGPGDEVIVPAMTFIAGAAAVRYVGAQPVFCDAVGVDDFNVDPAEVAARVTPRTKAVLAVHFMGYTSDVARLEAVCDEHGLALVEDAAQAIGARYPDGRRAGTAGDVGCFSLFSKKQLCVGEGGAVLARDEAVRAKVRSLRSHGMTSVTWDRHRGHAATYDIVDIGFNYRLDEPRAALAVSRLKRLDDDLARRRSLVRAYRERLADVPGLTIPWSDDAVERSSHFCFSVVTGDAAARDRLHAHMAAHDIQTTRYPAITSFSEYHAEGACPQADAIGSRHLALPLSSSYGEAEVEAVVAAVRSAPL